MRIYSMIQCLLRVLTHFIPMQLDSPIVMADSVSDNTIDTIDTSDTINTIEVCSQDKYIFTRCVSRLKQLSSNIQQQATKETKLRIQTSLIHRIAFVVPCRSDRHNRGRTLSMHHIPFMNCHYPSQNLKNGTTIATSIVPPSMITNKHLDPISHRTRHN